MKMKKIFKQLAIVLALALVLTSANGFEAKAASKYSIKKASKQLFVGGAKGVSEDGTVKSTVGYSYKVKGAIGGFKKGDKIKVTSADKSIVKVSGNKSEKARLVAVGIGDTTVTVSVKAKNAKKYVKAGKIKVQVKANADTLVINGAENNTVGIGADVAILTAKQTLIHDGKVKKSDDLIEFSIADEYKKIATITSDGRLTTLKPGTFKVVAKTYQNSKLTGATATAEIELKAIYDLTAAKQKSEKEISLVFGSGVRDSVTDKDFSVYYMSGTAEIKVPVNKIVINEKDATKAVLSVWNPFMAGTVYFVKYAGDEKAESFTAASLTTKDVASVVIETTEAVVNELTPIKYKVINADGVEMTVAPGAITFTTDDTAFCSITGGDIVFYEKNKTANVKWVFSEWFDNNGNWQEKKLEGRAAIVSREAAAVVTVDRKWTIADGIFTQENFENAKYAQTTELAVDDSDKYLHVYVKDSKDSVTVDDVNYKYESANKSILLIGSAIAPAKGARLVPVAEGTTQVIIKDKDDAVVFVADVKVGPARIVKTLTASFRDGKAIINNGYAPDKIIIDVAVNDNYGKAVNGANILIEKVSGLELVGTPAVYDNLDGTYEILIVNSNISSTQFGTYCFKLTAEKSGVKTNSQTVSVVSGDRALASTDKIKLAVSADKITNRVDSSSTPVDEIDFWLTYHNGEYQTGEDTTTVIYPDMGNGTYIPNATSYVYTLQKGSTKIEDPKMLGYNAVYALYEETDAYGKKMISLVEAGDYSIHLFEVTANGDGVATAKKSIDSKVVTFAVDRPSLSWTKNKNDFASVATDEAGISAEIISGNVFTVNYDGNPVADTANLSFKIKFSEKDAYVESVTYKIFIDSTYYFKAVAPVGVTLDRK